jgi:hypothetical protein
LESLAERVSGRASVKNVYGDPVVVGDPTVIPIAQMRYGFGGGARRRKGDDEAAAVAALWRGRQEPWKSRPKARGSSPFEDRRATGGALALGFPLGAALVALRGERQIDAGAAAVVSN